MLTSTGEAPSMSVWLHVRENFMEVIVARLIEWQFALILIGWGVLCINVPTIMQTGQSFAVLQLIGPTVIGFTAIIIGSTRIAILAYNGLLRRSPYYRAFLSSTSAGFWAVLALGFWHAPVWTTGIIPYTAFFFFEWLVTLLTVVIGVSKGK